MKKKIIEGIAYLRLPKLSRKEGVKFVGRTAIQEIKGEPHFFLEVYENKKTGKDIPVCRVVVNEKDFATYWPEKGVWTRNLLTNNVNYTDTLTWYQGYAGDYRRKRKENVLYEPEDIKRMKEFFKDVKVYDDADWWDYVSNAQDKIACAERMRREQRKYERRKQALADRMANTPELPKKEILDYADSNIFGHLHYLYYKKNGRKANICCSSCGGVYSGAFKAGVSYESTFEAAVEEPKENRRGTCKLCGDSGIYKCQGTSRNEYEKKSNIFLMSRYKETGVVIRYIEVAKEWVLDEISGKKGPEMYGAFEKLSGVEVARTYIHPDENVQTDYQKHSCYSGDFWDDCNLYGIGNIQIKAAVVHPLSWQALEGTCVQYSAVKEYYKHKRYQGIRLNDYMERYRETPQIEMLVKMKLYGVVDELIGYHYGIIFDEKAKKPHDYLGIKKDKLKTLIKHEGDESILRVLQMERLMDADWSEEQIEKLKEINISRTHAELGLQFMSMEKLLNNIEKYAGCSYGTGCTTSTAKLMNTATTYFDYLSMRQQRGYDLSNTVYQKPKSLTEAHNKLIAEIDKERQDKRIREVEEKFRNIKKNYRKLRNRYFYEDDNFIIRPARCAAEIVQEGRELHHCVGGDNYLKKHNDGESTILFLRFQSDPEIPYITIEIENERIRQWYGAHDKKPDEENIQRWLNAYTTRLKCKRYGVNDASEQDVMQRMLEYA